MSRMSMIDYGQKRFMGKYDLRPARRVEIMYIYICIIIYIYIEYIIKSYRIYICISWKKKSSAREISRPFMRTIE